MWYVVTSSYFEYLMFALIMLNTICLGMQVRSRETGQAKTSGLGRAGAGRSSHFIPVGISRTPGAGQLQDTGPE